MSCYRDLNPGPLPYQGSALPLSYNSKENKSCGQRWIRTTEGVSQQIYSLPHLATLVFALEQVENVELKVESEFFPSQFSLLFSIEVSNFAWNSQFSILNFPLL